MNKLFSIYSLFFFSTCFGISALCSGATIGKRVEHPQGFSFAPDAEDIVYLEKSDLTTQNNLVHRISAVTGKTVWTFDSKVKGGATSYFVQFSPDGKYVLVPQWGTIHLLDAKSGTELWSDQGHYAAAVFLGKNLLFARAKSTFHNGQYTSALTLALIDWETGIKNESTHYLDTVNYGTPGFSAEGKDVFINNPLDMFFRFSTEMTPPKSSGLVWKEPALNSWSHLAVSSQKVVALGKMRKNKTAVSIWDFGGKQLTEFPGYVDTLEFSPDGKYLAAGKKDEGIQIFDTAKWKELDTISTKLGYLDAIALSNKNIAWRTDKGDLHVEPLPAL